MNARQQFFYQSLSQIQNAFSTGYANLLLLARSLQQQFQQYACIIPSRFPYHYSEEAYTIDHEARNIYPLDAPSNLIPVRVVGDGNCLFRSFSLLMFGNENHHIEMRARASVELICNTEYYLNERHLFHSNSGRAIFWIAHYSSSAADSYLDMNVRTNQLTVLWNCIQQAVVLNSWVGMWHICALASVIQSCVRSIYPAESVQINRVSQVRNVLNVTIFPRIQNASLELCSVMWSRVGTTHGFWQPNHFVPCLQNLQEGMLGTRRTTNEPVKPFKNSNTTSECTMRALRSTNIKNKAFPQLKPNQSKSSPGPNEIDTPFKTDHSDRNSLNIKNVNRNREKKNGYYRNKRANESQEEKASRLYKRREADKVRKHKRLKHDLSPVELFLKSVTGIAALFCVLCLKFGYPDSFHYVAQDSTLLSEVNDFIDECSNTSISKIPLCQLCFASLRNCKMPACNRFNRLDARSVPPVMENLTFMEKRFIAQIHVFMTVLSLPAGGQYAQDGLCINFPVDFQNLYQDLDSQDDKDIIIVKPASSTLSENSQISIENVVRKSVLQNCLMWLKKHNRHYSDINISMCTSKITHLQPELLESCEQASLAQISFTPTNYVPKKGTLSSLIRKKSSELPIICLKKQKTKPANMFSEHEIEEVAFPWLFPYGVNGLKTNRKPTISVLQYFQNRLLGKENRWRKNATYIFWALNMYEQHKLQQCISIAVRKSSICDLGKGQSKKHNNYNQKFSLDHNIIDSSYTFIRQIRGTAGYWKNVLQNLLAKIRTLGPPTWFLTLSADDLHWPDLMSFLESDTTPDITRDPVNSAKLVRENPVMVAQHFVKRWKSLFKHVILNGKEGALGEVTDYFVRVEFQNRGSPHLHIFLWIKDAPNLASAEGKKQFPQFIDQYVSSQIPNKTQDFVLNNLVSTLQIHHHTETCRKGKSLCRFNFPRPPSVETKIKAGINPITSKSFYETRRKAEEAWVNPYNPTILQAWQANMDIQFVGSVFAIALYVCSYVCKAEPARLRKAVNDIINKLKTDCGFSKRKQLSKLGTAILSSREISAQEAAFRLTGLPLTDSSRATLYVNARTPNKRVRILKPQLHKIGTSTLNNSSFVDGLPENYAKRPNNDLFNNMSVATFASWYTWCTNPNETVNEQQGTEISKKQPRFMLQNKKTIRQRTKPACLRTPYLSPLKDGDDYYYMFLFLFLPWRDENELISPYKTAREAFDHKKEHFEMSVAQFSDLAEELERAVQNLRIVMAENADEIMASLTPNTTHNAANELASDMHVEVEPWQELIKIRNNDSDDNIDQNDVSDNDHQWKTLSLYTMTDKDFTTAISHLSGEQKKVFNLLVSHIQKRKRYEQGEVMEKPNPLFLFVTGAGGTGKSFLISVINEYLLRASNHNSMTVIKTAPTGVAAYNIQGVTLHRAFCLPVTHKNQNVDYTSLSAERLQQLRNLYQNLSTVIIDEISMVSYKILKQIHLRLLDIRDCHELMLPFAHVNILAFGDFFQLKPVMAPYLFTEQQCSFHLWRDLFQIQNLTKNHRQKGDLQYAELLGRVRTGQQNGRDIALLKSRLNAHVHLSEKEFEAALRIFPTNGQCDEYNSERLQLLLQATSQKAFIVKAEDVLLNSNKIQPYESEEMFLPQHEQDCGGLPHSIELAIGMRVMLIKNIDLSIGLVNGAIGTITHIQFPGLVNQRIESNHTMPQSVSVNFDASKTVTSSDKVIEVRPVTTKFFGLSNSVWQRTQLPLKPCWAATVHKVQGLTLSKAVVDVGEAVFQAGMAYVALSRVKSLQGLSLTALCEKRIFASEIVKEYYTLHSLR